MWNEAVKLTLCVSCSNLPAYSPPLSDEGYTYQDGLGLSKYLADGAAPANAGASDNETSLGTYPIFNLDGGADGVSYRVDSGPGPSPL